jgi:hypothetical protein
MKDLRNLKTNGSASLAELQAFLGTLRGRSPQEVIGIVSTSLLVQSLVISTVATIGILAVFTVLPYLIYGPPKTQTAAAKAPAAAPADEGKTPAASSSNEAPAATDPTKPDVAKATKALGLDDTKTADPNKNPLESSPNLDKLLDQ